MDISPTGLEIGTMGDIDFPGMMTEARNHKYLAFGLLTLVLWEWLIALQGEVRFIWRCPSRKTKTLYFFARYFAVGYMSLNLVLSFKWTSLFPMSQSHCIRWYVQLTSAFVAQYVIGYLTLLKRVLELHKRRDVAITFVTFHLAELVGVFFSSKGTVTAMKFDSTCRALSVSKDAFLFLAFFVSGQVMIWSLIFRGVWKPDERHYPRLDIRAKFYRAWHEGDGKAVWAVCVVGLVFNTINCYVRQRTEPTHLFGWPISFLSIATCRYIMSSEKEAYIRSRFSPSISKGKERAIQTPDDVEDGIEITVTVNPASPLDMMGHFDFARSQSQSSVQSADGLHPIGLYNLVTITSTAGTEPPPDVVLSTSPTNSIVLYERQRSRTVSLETQETAQTEITSLSHGDVSSRSSRTDIEIGSMHTSSSINSEELGDFWNETWNRTVHTGPFIG